MHLNIKRLCDCVYSGKGALYTQMIAKKKNRSTKDVQFVISHTNFTTLAHLLLAPYFMYSWVGPHHP